MFQATLKSNGDQPIVFLKGRIDSSNASQAEQQIRDLIPEDARALALDAGELAYISSAGLRVVLRLKKMIPDTRIVNVNSDVYEIFDMTGFTEMMDIVKAYRQLSVEGCEVIGEGANGKVYRIDGDTIVKVYKNRDALEEIHNERELARKAFVMGIPTAIPYDVVQVGDLYGSVFELLDAKSFAKLIAAAPEKTADYARQSAEILKTMHQTMLEPGELPDKKQEALVWANFCVEHLPQDVGAKLVELVRAIPDTRNMLHGDFHVKNIMQQNGENLLIDMDTLSMGHPVFEFAAIYAAYIGFSCVDRLNVTKFLGLTPEQAAIFWETTLDAYFDGDQAKIAQVKRAAPVICYARLLRRTMRRHNADDPHYGDMIEFCKQYLIDEVPKIDTLSF